MLLVPTNVPAVRSSQENIVRLVRYMKSRKSREIYLFFPTFFISRRPEIFRFGLKFSLVSPDSIISFSALKLSWRIYCYVSLGVPTYLSIKLYYQEAVFLYPSQCTFSCVDCVQQMLMSVLRIHVRTEDLAKIALVDTVALVRADGLEKTVTQVCCFSLF